MTRTVDLYRRSFLQKASRFLAPHPARAIRRASVAMGAVLLASLLSAGPLRAAQPEQAPPPAREGQAAAAQAEGHAAEAEHEEGLLPLVARLVNFGILAGALIYLLRSPLARYLKDRSEQVRKDLVSAAELRQSATEQLAEIDRKLAALPGEIEALRARGAEEIAAEEARIRKAAEAEGLRLLEQTRREIDLQLRMARRELVKEAAELAVGVASTRVKRDITDEDQLRLVDRYVRQVSARRE